MDFKCDELISEKTDADSRALTLEKLEESKMKPNANSMSVRNDLHVFTTCGFIVELQNIPQKHDTPVIDRILSDNSLFQIEKWPHL